jgi:hypothetical protein
MSTMSTMWSGKLDIYLNFTDCDTIHSRLKTTVYVNAGGVYNILNICILVIIPYIHLKALCEEERKRIWHLCIISGI